MTQEDSSNYYIPSEEDLQGFASTFYEEFLAEKGDLAAAGREDRQTLAGMVREDWQDALDLYEVSYGMARSVADDFSETYRRSGAADGDSVFQALRALHARALLTTSEVYALLASGHATGAMARWRTLHELASTAYFIQRHGQDVATRYLDHITIERYEDAQELVRMEVALGFDPPTEEQTRPLREHRNALISQYGKEFGTHYGWAAKVLSEKRPTFVMIEAASGIDNMRVRYGSASRGIHAKGSGLLYNPGVPRSSTGIGVTPSVYGLSEPGIGAVIALTQCTIALGAGCKPPDNIENDEWVRLAALRALVKLSKEAIDAFSDAEEKVQGQRNSPAPLPPAIMPP